VTYILNILIVPMTALQKTKWYLFTKLVRIYHYFKKKNQEKYAIS